MPLSGWLVWTVLSMMMLYLKVSMVWVCWALLGFPVPGEDVKSHKQKQRPHHYRKRYARISAIIYVSNVFTIVLLCVMTTTHDISTSLILSKTALWQPIGGKNETLVRRHLRDWTNMNYVDHLIATVALESMKKKRPNSRVNKTLNM